MTASQQQTHNYFYITLTFLHFTLFVKELGNNSTHRIYTTDTFCCMSRNATLPFQETCSKHVCGPSKMCAPISIYTDVTAFVRCYSDTVHVITRKIAPISPICSIVSNAPIDCTNNIWCNQQNCKNSEHFFLIYWHFVNVWNEYFESVILIYILLFSASCACACIFVRLWNSLNRFKGKIIKNKTKQKKPVMCMCIVHDKTYPYQNKKSPKTLV